MRFQTLPEWLAWQESLHPREIDLGLDRVREVFQRMGLGPPPFSVVTVAGTNGKGSSVAMLDAILGGAGYRVAGYTSPHLLRYNERVRVAGQTVSDADLCGAFARVDEARGDVSLTYFEFGTLAALDIFYRQRPELVLLEVGLGGRLDAVNILDADVALLTAIGVDHAAWLGDDRGAIAREKAGILRPGRAAVCADPDLPDGLEAYVQDVGARAVYAGRDFGYEAGADSWAWRWGAKRRTGLPYPALLGEFQLGNASGVLAVLELLAADFPLTAEQIRRGLATARIAGRFQVQAGEVERIFDVAHNPQAAGALRRALERRPCPGQTRAVVAMLADKDIVGVVRQMGSVVDAWYVAGLAVPRGSSAAHLAGCLTAAGVDSAPTVRDSVAAAYGCALADARRGDRVVVFGSFSTVAEVLRQGL